MSGVLFSPPLFLKSALFIAGYSMAVAGFSVSDSCFVELPYMLKKT